MPYFVSDYRPTKRIGIEELDGAINLMSRQIEDIDYSTNSWLYDHYIGALLTLEIIRHGTFEYPHEFLQVFENRLHDLELGG